MAKEITDANFVEETNKGLVLIDFWAPWCGPCRMQAPIIDKLAETYDESDIKIMKLDVESNQGVPARYGVMSIPTMVLLKDGELVDKVVGLQTQEQLEALIAPHM